VKIEFVIGQRLIGRKSGVSCLIRSEVNLYGLTSSSEMIIHKSSN
jgi:hypothetical protein